MKVERDYTAPVASAEALQRARRQLVQQGFRSVLGEEHTLTRGSLLGSVLSSNPAHLATTVQINADSLGQGSTVHLAMEVHAHGQILTTADMLFWKSELEVFDTALQRGVPVPADLRHARSATIAGIAVPMLSTLVPLAPAFLLAALLGSFVVGLGLYTVLTLVCFVLGIAWLRRNMPSAEMLAQPTQSAVLGEMGQIVERLDDLERLELEDFDKRLFGDENNAQQHTQHQPVDERALEELLFQVSETQRK